MSERSLGRLLLVGGVLVCLVALTADWIGLGPHPGIGLKQVALALVGVTAAGFGLAKLRDRT